MTKNKKNENLLFFKKFYIIFCFKLTRIFKNENKIKNQFLLH